MHSLSVWGGQNLSGAQRGTSDSLQGSTGSTAAAPTCLLQYRRRLPSTVNSKAAAARAEPETPQSNCTLCCLQYTLRKPQAAATCTAYQRECWRTGCIKPSQRRLACLGHNEACWKRRDTLMLLQVTFLHQNQLRLEASTEEYPIFGVLIVQREDWEAHLPNHSWSKPEESSKSFWVRGKLAFLLDVSQHQMMEVACLQVHMEHSMLQLHLPRPFSPCLRHPCGLTEAITFWGPPTSFHKWDSEQLTAQGLPENIPYTALPVAPNALSAKPRPRSLCSLRVESQYSENNPLGRPFGRELHKCIWTLTTVVKQHCLSLSLVSDNTPLKQQRLQCSPNTTSQAESAKHWNSKWWTLWLLFSVLTPNCAKISGPEASLLTLALVTSTAAGRFFFKRKKKKH